jgi:hypothetical protein
MHNPSEDHMDSVIQILRYLKASPGKGLMFSKNNHLKINGYTDADLAGSILDRKSTLGYFMFVGGNLVTWRSKKKKVVALSSAEAKFRGMAKRLCELLWIRRLLTELRFTPTSEHMEVDRHFIKENFEEKIIRFPFVKSEDQPVDILTKAVSSKEFYNSLDKLCLRDLHAST